MSHMIKERLQKRFEFLLEDACSCKDSSFIKTISGIHDKLDKDQGHREYNFWSLAELDVSKHQKTWVVLNFIDHSHQVAIYRYTGSRETLLDRQRAVYCRDSACRYVLDMTTGAISLLGQQQEPITQGFNYPQSHHSLSMSL